MLLCLLAWRMTEQQHLPRFISISSLAAREPHLSPYAESKKKGEEILAKRAGDRPWAVLRPPAVYGPGDKELLPLFRWMFRGIGPVLGPPEARLLFSERTDDWRYPCKALVRAGEYCEL